MASEQGLRREATAASDRSVVVSRVFDAPQESVFQAFADPQKLAQWFAPEPFTIPKSESDFRVGGRYMWVMRDEDGNDFTATGEYRDIAEPERLVFTDSVESMPRDWVDMLNEARGSAKGTPVPDGIVTVTFENVGGKTKVTYREDFDSKATRDAYVELQMIEGLNGSFDKLETVLEKTPAAMW